MDFQGRKNTPPSKQPIPLWRGEEGNSMTITSVYSAYGAQSGNAVAARAKPKAVPSVYDAGASVQFSDLSKSMQAVKDKINSLPEIRIQMVEEIKAKIASSDYPVENKMMHAMEALVNGIMSN
jgi:flagellar biosynthesis anti-sigma factor FlgM